MEFRLPELGRIDEKNHVWYAATRVPLKSVSDQPVKSRHQVAREPIPHRRPGRRSAASLHVLAAHVRGKSRSKPRAGAFRNHDLHQVNHVPLSIRIFILSCLEELSARAEHRVRQEALRDAVRGLPRRRWNRRRARTGTGWPRGIARALGGRHPQRHSQRVSRRRACRRSRLQPNQLEDLVAYVHALRSPAADSPAPGDAAEGERFFFGKGDCASCHTVRGRGGWIGPDLSDLGRRRSLTEIESALKDPGRRVTPGFAVVTVHLRNDGSTVRGLLKNESTFDVQLQRARRPRPPAGAG